MQHTDRPVLRSRAWPAACGALLIVVLVLATIGVEQPVVTATVLVIALGIAVAVLAWAATRSRRQRRAYEEELTHWAAERAAQAERLRIARDLHDLASHGLGLITLRAAAARGVTGAEGDAERGRALADIESAGRTATGELRRMLSVLREPGEVDAPLRPTDSLADLPAIVAAARSAGVQARLEIADLGEVSAGVQVAVCALVREALANVARHAGPTTAQVGVHREGGVVVVMIDDGGPASGWQPHPGAGHGLIGVEERVAALGGTLETGPHGGGFRVLARLPDEAVR